MGPKISSRCKNEPLFHAKTGLNMGHIFKIFKICVQMAQFSQFDTKIYQILKIIWNFLHNLLKICGSGIKIGLILPQNLV